MHAAAHRIRRRAARRHLLRAGRFALGALALLAVLQRPAGAEISAAMAAAGWEEITFSGYEENVWSEIDNGVRVRSDGGISIVFRRLDADLDATPILTWRWRSDNAPAATDLSQDKGEDRALSLYVAFPHEPERASFAEGLRYSMLRMTQGEDTPGRVMTYVWGGMRPKGTLLKRSNTAALIIQRTPAAAVDSWHRERVDVAADFQAAFGWEPPDPTHIGLTSDSDDTGRAIDAMVADIAWVAR